MVETEKGADMVETKTEVDMEGTGVDIGIKTAETRKVDTLIGQGRLNYTLYNN